MSDRPIASPAPKTGAAAHRRVLGGGSPRRRSPSTRGYRARRLVLTLLALLGAGASLLASSASAGNYQVSLCQTPRGTNAPAEGIAFSNNVDWVNYSNTCGSPGGSIKLGLGSLPRSSASYMRASLTAPVGTSFGAVAVTRYATIAPGNAGDSGDPLFAFYRDYDRWDAEHVLESCTILNHCAAVPYGTPVTMLGKVWRLIWSVECGGALKTACAGTSVTDRVTAEIAGLGLLVNDDESPWGTATGPALQQTVHRDQPALAIEAGDFGGGVYQALVTIDGIEAASGSVGGACVDAGSFPGLLDFERLKPCPNDWRFDLAVNTRVVADGRHDLAAYVIDAAGNKREVQRSAIDIDNVPPPKVTAAPTIVSAAGDDVRPGDQLTVSPGSWTGANIAFEYQWQRSGDGAWGDVAKATGARYSVTAEDVGHRLRVLVRATNREGTAEALSNATAEVRSGATVRPQSVGPVAAPVEDGAPQLVVDREQRSVQVARGAKIVVTGRLVDAESKPIADAEVEVFEQVAIVGAPWQKVATVKTDGQGGYAYRPSTGGSRTLRFAYAARRDSGDYRATRDVVISVVADVRLRAVPRVVARGGLMRLRGRVSVDPLPASGTWVEIQVLDAGVWRTIGTRKTSSKGGFQFRHRLRRVGAVTFTFRARLRPAADLPAVESKSAPVKVRVR